MPRLVCLFSFILGSLLTLPGCETTSDAPKAQLKVAQPGGDEREVWIARIDVRNFTKNQGMKAVQFPPGATRVEFQTMWAVKKVEIAVNFVAEAGASYDATIERSGVIYTVTVRHSQTGNIVGQGVMRGIGRPSGF